MAFPTHFRVLMAAGTLALASCTTVPDANDTVPDSVAAQPSGALALLPILDDKAGPADNVVLSPLSIDLAFGLLHAGARGETRAQIESILPTPRDPLNFETDQRDVEVLISNALFLDDGYRFRREYIDETRRKFDAEPVAVEFGAKQASTDTINAWANDATKGLIPKVITPDAIDDMTIAILANALYFEGLWQTKLDRSATRKFLFGNGTERDFKFVGETFATPHVAQDGWEAVRLPYRNTRYAMDILMPARREVMDAAPSLARIEGLKQALDADDADDLIKVEIPQFETDFAISLKDPLIALGLTLPFDALMADLTGIAEPGQRRPHVSDVRHVTKLQVYDEGTKAAAVTTISIVVTGARIEPDNVIPFRADRPFVVVLRDLERDAVLFIGRIADPQAFEPEVDEG